MATVDSLWTAAVCQGCGWSLIEADGLCARCARRSLRETFPPIVTPVYLTTASEGLYWIAGTLDLEDLYDPDTGRPYGRDLTMLSARVQSPRPVDASMRTVLRKDGLQVVYQRVVTGRAD